MEKFRIGNDLTVFWAILDDEGQPYDLSGKTVRIFLTHPRGREELTEDVDIQDHVISWLFRGTRQRYLGVYKLTVEISSAPDTRMLRRDIDEAFALVSATLYVEEADGRPQINETGKLTLSTILEIYQIMPVVPHIGPNRNWWVDGKDTGKPSTGKSAYEYAKENGYEGSEQEYSEVLVAVPEVVEEMDELQQVIGTQVIPSLDRKADLENGKIVAAQLPDYILGQVMYGGIIYEDTRVLPSYDFSKKYPEKSERLMKEGLQANDHIEFTGCYFIVGGETVNATLFGHEVSTGDWIISTRVSWAKVDNTDAVVSVAGLVGHVEVTALADALGLPALIRRIVELEKKLAQGAKKEITFTIADYNGEDRTFTALEGMTWEEFCESEYNVDAWEVEDSFVFLYTAGWNTDFYLYDREYVSRVIANHKIQAKEYLTYNEGIGGGSGM